MFTGIVECTGVVVAPSRPHSLPADSSARLMISSPLRDLVLGDSIAVNGVCLTVTNLEGERFTADLSEETLRRTNLGWVKEGDLVNLERPLPVDGRFGGHVVQGHVDAVGGVARCTRLPGSVEMWFSVPEDLQRYLVEKGSVTVDGVSLTVSELKPGAFSVALIPHTLESTTLGSKAPGDRVNIEVDVLAKYVERLIDRSVR